MAVLTFNNDLFISTDLHSWTKTIVLQRDTSLTTYQSKFVLVGGCHLSTHEPTSTILTSNSGLQWESSLPAMPTKRYLTSTVSTSSPEVLVVAGGRGSNDEDLDVVEVLLNENWTTVEPLPEPDSLMSSALHDGDLHFMGGSRQGTSVYTCSCSSLISFATESVSNISDRPLWRQYHVPGKKTTAVSYSSRLTNIDGWGTVRGYSSTTQSWEKVTSTGDMCHRNACHTAATVLSTAEIVFCHRYEGIYKIELSSECITTFTLYP